MEIVQIVLCTLGTMGDIQPFWQLAEDLVGRGHRVVVLSNENWEQRTLAIGAEFVAIAPKDPTQSGRDNYRFFVTNVVPAFDKMYSYVRERVTGGARLVLVAKPQMLGMDCAAEAFKLPLVHIALQPSAVKSFERPPWPWTSLALGRGRRLYKALIIPLLFAAEALGRYRRVTNRFRRKLGLRRIHFQWARNAADLTLVLCPKWFGMPQSDWPKNSKCVGFVFTQPRPDTRVETFVAQHTKPLVFTPGTGITDVAAFFVRAQAVCDRLGRPGIFLSPQAQVQGGADHILCCDYADLGSVLPHASAIIHHGGIGTTAQALRAGVPQIVLPGNFDQPDNATRVASLGLGAAVMSSDIKAEALAAIVEPLLTDEAIAARLVIASALIRQQDAAKTLVEIIGLVVQKAASRKIAEGDAH